MHIAIAGNIGSGKTTLTKMLANHYGWTPKFESVDFNPYLADFYEDMERWSFNLQIYFLNKRFQDVVEISKHKEVIIQDRTIYEDARIFAPNLHAMGLMSTRDFENYSDLFDLMMSLVNPPDLMIYLPSGGILRYLHANHAVTRPCLERTRRQAAGPAVHIRLQAITHVAVGDHARAIRILHEHLVARHRTGQYRLRRRKQPPLRIEIPDAPRISLRVSRRYRLDHRIAF